MPPDTSAVSSERGNNQEGEMLQNISPPASPPAPAEQAESLRYNLFVSIQSCQNLPARKHGTSDPFVKFTVGGKMVHRTKTMKSDLNPVWDEACEFTIEPDALEEKKIELFVLDRKGLFTRYISFFT